MRTWGLARPMSFILILKMRDDRIAAAAVLRKRCGEQGGYVLFGPIELMVFQSPGRRADEELFFRILDGL